MSELPRVLFCCFDVVPAPHATSRRLSEYLKGLAERYQTVVLSVKTPDHSHIERYHGARLLRVPVGSGDLRTRMEAFDRAVRRQLESEEYLIVHFFDPVSGYPLCERRGDFGYKLVYDACRFPSGDLPSLLPQEGSNKRLLARSRRQELFCLMNADAVIVGSEAAKAHCVSLGVTADHLNVVRAPVDLAPYSPELMGKPDGQPARLIHLGSHGRHQDLPLLFEALSKTKTPVKLALVGPTSPELTPPLKERVAELQLGERVEFQEPVGHDDLHKVLAAADVGVLTLSTDARNTSTTALARIGEFLAAGRPIIAADLPLTRELVPADAARFYPPGDVSALAEVIDALAADPALRRTLGAAARAATSAIDTQVVRQHLIALYERVAPQARPPSDTATVDPSEATQLGGRPPDEMGDVTQAGAPLPIPDSGRHDLGTNKVKTDPALQAPPPDADTGTDQALARERPPVMGVLLRDDAPPVAPETTDPAIVSSREPPIVMGLPVTDRLPDADAVEPLAPREGPPVPDEEPRSPTDPSLPPVATAAPTPTAPPVPPPAPDAPTATAPGTGAAPTAAAPPTPTAAAAPTPTATAAPTPTAAAVPSPAPKPPAAPVPPAPLPGPLAIPDDEPLDLSSLLKPTAPVRPSRVTSPEITSPSPAPVPRAPPPAPIPVPTSFSLPTRPVSSPPGATFVPIPIGVPVTTTPARVPLAGPAPSAPGPAPLPAPPARPPPPPVAAAAAPALAGPPPIPGSARSPSGVRPLPAPPAAPPAPTALPDRAPPASVAPASPSGVRAIPDGKVSAADVPGGLPPLVRLVPNPSGGAPMLARAEPDEPVEEVLDDEVELVNDESFASLHDEPEEIDSHVHALDTSATPPPSRLDPWFAQLVHGYCPPQSQLFDRHVPPTTMPGRDT